jgi:hypothetical protein
MINSDNATTPVRTCFHSYPALNPKLVQEEKRAAKVSATSKAEPAPLLSAPMVLQPSTSSLDGTPDAMPDVILQREQPAMSVPVAAAPFLIPVGDTFVPDVTAAAALLAALPPVSLPTPVVSAAAYALPTPLPPPLSPRAEPSTKRKLDASTVSWPDEDSGAVQVPFRGQVFESGEGFKAAMAAYAAHWNVVKPDFAFHFATAVRAARSPANEGP